MKDFFEDSDVISTKESKEKNTNNPVAEDNQEMKKTVAELSETVQALAELIKKERENKPDEKPAENKEENNEN